MQSLILSLSTPLARLPFQRKPTTVFLLPCLLPSIPTPPDLSTKSKFSGKQNSSSEGGGCWSGGFQQAKTGEGSPCSKPSKPPCCLKSGLSPQQLGPLEKGKSFLANSTLFGFAVSSTALGLDFTESPLRPHEVGSIISSRSHSESLGLRWSYFRPHSLKHHVHLVCFCFCPQIIVFLPSFFFFLSWSMIALQRCAGFCCSTK